MENTNKSYSAREFLDPGLNSVDEIIVQFEDYKISRQQEQQEFEQELKNLSWNAGFGKLNTKVEKLQVGLQELQKQQELQLQQRELDAIEPAPLEDLEDCSYETDDQEEHTESSAQLVVCSGVSQCVYHDCQRRVDNQLLLLHYLCDHNQPDSYCLSVLEGEQAVLSFQPQSCVFQVNKVLGLLTYGGRLEQQFGVTQRRQRFYNAFLPDQHSHLATHVPVVVLICQTAAYAALRSKKLEGGDQWLLDNLRDTVFVIWLVTPSDRHRMNASLSLCGRDAALRVGTVIAVRKVNNCQDTASFMTVDSNYWRLTYSEMERLSNQFRDELNLEITLTEPSASN